MSYSTSLEINLKKVFKQGYVSCIRFTSGAISFFFLIDVSATSGLKKENSTAFLYIAKRNQTLCTLYINIRGNFVFYSIIVKRGAEAILEELLMLLVAIDLVNTK